VELKAKAGSAEVPFSSFAMHSHAAACSSKSATLAKRI
jgi:hypothetical protein